jgi:opacity protein-like surface antigen
MTMRRVLLALSIAAVAVPVASASAATNPSGTGQPNQTCQTINATSTNPSGATGTFYPGNAQNARGSVFAEPGGTFANGGTGGQAYNNNGAPSQYDVACYQQSQRP